MGGTGLLFHSSGPHTNADRCIGRHRVEMSHIGRCFDRVSPSTGRGTRISGLLQVTIEVTRSTYILADLSNPELYTEGSIEDVN